MISIFVHFVPVYSGLGYIVHSSARGKISGDLCIGYDAPENEYYRIFPNGLNEFKEEYKYLHKDNQAAHGSGIDYGCSKPVLLKLYLW